MASHPGRNLGKKYGLILIVAAVACLDLVFKDSFIQQEQQQQANRDDWKVARLDKTHVDPVTKVKASQAFTAGNTSIESNNLWNNSTKIPQWMKEYFRWHQETLSSLNEENWDSYHYFCTDASQPTKKVLRNIRSTQSSTRATQAGESSTASTTFVHLLESPRPLGRVSRSADGRYELSIPHWLAEKVNIEQQGPKYFFESKRDFDKFPRYSDVIARVKNVRGSEYYDRSRGENELTFDQVYHEVWNILFQPSPAIGTLVKKEQQEMQLQPGHYVAAHIRALYLSDAVDRHEEINAIYCARSLRPGWPIFVASDSVNTTRAAVAYGQQQNWNVVARQAKEDPLHLDRGRDFLVTSEDWKGRPASDFYDVFVDLYLLVGSRCVAHGIGGFGSWASLVAGTQDCVIDHRKQNCSATA